MCRDSHIRQATLSTQPTTSSTGTNQRRAGAESVDSAATAGRSITSLPDAINASRIAGRTGPAQTRRARRPAPVTLGVTRSHRVGADVG
ncbi:hypothetical protein GCM10011576_46000 [Micromonospora parathelypteridis]|nr:hypothetical protein GCM10011576_46000 [Micromonospora parathelypteridis]